MICLIGLILFGIFGLMLLCVFFSMVNVCIGILGCDYVLGVGERLFVLVFFVILNMVKVIFLGSAGLDRNYFVLV